MRSVGIQALAVHLPEGVRTNAWWGGGEPSSPPPPLTARPPGDLYTASLLRYADDPFFGSAERRVVTGDDNSVTLGVRAARKVLATAGLLPGDVDGLIAVSMFPDRVGAGDAGYLAQALGTGGGAFSMEATCSGSMAALLTACALVRSGLKDRVLVVAVSVLSRAVDNDVTSRLHGDAAAAFVVGPVEDGAGLLGADTLHTGETCGTWVMDTAADPTGSTAGGRRIRLNFDPSVAHILKSTAEPYLLRTSQAALKAAGLAVSDVDHLIVNTPTAWHAEFSAGALGIEQHKVTDTFREVANIGPAMMPFNVFTAAVHGRIKPGDLVLLYSFGGQAEACAAVFRWPVVALGPVPAPADLVDPASPFVADRAVPGGARV